MASQKLHNGGGTGPFIFDFPSLEESDIKVSVGGNSETGFSINNYDSVTGGEVTIPGGTASGTDNVRIYRQTEPETLAATFVVGSSISANDLNNCNKQTIFLADENRTSINSLALGNSGSAIQISGSNIVDNSISSSKIVDLEVKTADINNLAVTTDKINNLAVTEGKIADDNVTADKLKDSTSTDSDRAVTTNHIRDGAVTDAKLSTISGSKITPNFGSQNISTTGTLNAGTTTAGSLTVTGTSTFSGDITTSGNDIYLDSGTLISVDFDGAFSARSGSNIDHIWHNDTNSDSNTGWNFVSDGTYKQTGNAVIQAGSIRCYSQDAMMFSNPSDRTINDSDEDDPIHFETVDLQKGGTNDSNSKSRITVSQDGIYLVTCCLSGQVNTHSHSDGIAIVLRKNGSIFPRESAFPVESFGSENGMEWSFTFAITEQFSANDYLEVVFRNIEGTASATLNKGYFCVTRLH